MTTRSTLGWGGRLAFGGDVVAHVAKAFLAHSTPLVLKHHEGRVFHGDKVRAPLQRFGGESLTGPRHYLGVNGC